MDCKHARLLLAFVRPGNPTELDDGEAADLTHHLDGCPVCAGLAHDEQRADDRIGRAMRDVVLPEGLRTRLLNRVNAARDAWYRGWLVRVGGVAAGVLIAVLIARAWFAPPSLSGDTAAFTRVYDLQPREAADVEKAFKDDFQVGMKAPTELRYDLLQGYHMATFQGQQVPYLLLVSTPRPGGSAVVAQVFVLSTPPFDWDKAGELAASLQSVRVSVSVHKIPGTNYFYVIVYTGGDRDLFLKKNPLDI
jgi:hypothetical protein